MTVLLVGGGTGGHIAPLLPIAAKIKAHNKRISVIAVTDKGGSFNGVLDASDDVDKVIRISGGKYRRYPNQKKLERLLDAKTHALNVRDSFRTVKGLSQALRIIAKQKPSIIFIKGGYISVPVGIAARMKGIPYITHDSDAVPSLVSKIIGKNALLRFSGMPETGAKNLEVQHIGVPVSDNFKSVTKSDAQRLKRELGVPSSTPLVLVTGGSQGAQRINQVVSSIVPRAEKAKIFIIHQTGGQGSAYNQQSDYYKSVSYIDMMYKYSGAADVIVSRAGSSLAEFAQQMKPVIAIPAKQLAGGHQVLNAKILKDQGAAVVLDEDKLIQDPSKLYYEISKILTNKSKAALLTKNAKKVYPGDAASKIANILIQYAK